MITFLISLAALVLGYLVYGRFVERIFAPDDRVTPAVAQADGLDYVAMPYWKVFMIQFLNIAGTGPIFGAIMGAKFGPAAYLWIIFGCIFAGAVHDYFVGMLSMRNGGCDLPELVRRYLGGAASKVLLVFAVFLPALGAAIVFDIGASTGGTDIVALILAKYTSMEIGKALMVSDILIVLAAAVRFGMGTGLYCILGLIGKSFVVDGAIENIRLRKVCTIMTANPQPILDFIIHDMNRSATVEKAYGAYTHHELSVLVTVLTRRQALQLRNFLRENDPHSFITIVNSSEIIGKGFRSFN